MTQYIIRRLLIMPVLLFGVTILIFAMLQLLGPYERAALYVSDAPEKVEGGIERIIEKYGLDDPIYVQYWRWLKRVVHGDLGFSKTGKQPVWDVLKQRFPATAELAIWSVVPMLAGGIWLGVTAAVHHNKPIDHVARVFSIVGWSFPTYVFGLVMLMIFYAKLHWFPPGRLSNEFQQLVLSDAFHRYTGMNTFDAILNGRFDVFWDAVRHLVLPVIGLSYLNWALLLRITRSSMLETLGQDYVTTARAKGLPEKDVINKHAKPNAMIPVATIGGMMILGLASGVVITETVFNYPGLGSWVAQAASTVDVISVLGFTLFNGVLLVLGNLVVDVLYAVIDPRVRLG